MPQAHIVTLFPRAAIFLRRRENHRHQCRITEAAECSQALYKEVRSTKASLRASGVWIGSLRTKTVIFWQGPHKRYILQRLIGSSFFSGGYAGANGDETHRKVWHRYCVAHGIVSPSRQKGGV
jgi:hypothetical protein